MHCIRLHYAPLLTVVAALFFLPSLLKAQEEISILHAPKSVVSEEEFSVVFSLTRSASDSSNALVVSLPKYFQTPRLARLGGSTAFQVIRPQLPSPQSGRVQFVFQLPDSLPTYQPLCLTARSADINLPKSERLNFCLASVSRQEAGRLTLSSAALFDAPNNTIAGQKNLTILLTPKTRTDNFAGQFDSTARLHTHLATTRTPLLSLSRSFTAELWFRTVALDGILLSSWSGSESDGYPLELEIGRDGTLASFFGFPFSFKKLHSNRFIADGVWHHCAVTLDSASGAVHLYLDGIVQDSTRLGIERRTFTMRPTPIYIGSRNGREKFFHGEADEIKIYRRAKRASELFNPELYDQDDDPTIVFYESFSSSQRSALVGDKPSLSRSSLAVAARLKNLRAEISGSDVWLSWEFSGQSDISSFTVERSLNGVQFQPLSTIDYRATQGFYRFFDRNAGELGKVVFYRLRKNTAGRSATYTGAIKIGLAETKPSFRLFQNTPNPFNPSTTISYELAEGATVELYVYNTLGTEVARVKRGFQPAGRYTFFFNAADYDLSSGIYLYRLQTDFGAETRKMILMK
jgi:hypothetical protein